jgi:capsular polysaccharide biosynthesis protein
MFISGINHLLLSPKRKIQSQHTPGFGVDDGDYNTDELSSIFTKEYSTHEVILSELKNCLVGPKPEGLQRYWPILVNDRYLWNFINNQAKELLHQQNVITLKDDLILKEDQKKTIKISGRSVWLYLFDNIDHLYRESLTTITALKEIYGDISDFTFVIPHTSQSYVNILVLMGIQKSQILQVGNTWLEFESVIISSFHSFGHLHTPSHYYTKLCSNLSNRVSRSLSLSPEKIFVSRRNASLRRLENESMLYEYLKINNYFICDPGDYTLEEQIEIFSKAKIIVGSHGMGIANSAFSNNLQHLIEIMPVTWNRVSYYRTAQLKDCHYSCYWVKENECGKLLINHTKFTSFLEEEIEKTTKASV